MKMGSRGGSPSWVCHWSFRIRPSRVFRHEKELSHEEERHGGRPANPPRGLVDGRVGIPMDFL